MTDLKLTAWYIETLTGDVNTIIDWRCIHDQRKDLPAHTYRGTLSDIAPTLEDYNQRGYGIFCTINQLDGKGHELTNVQHIRTQVIDLDNKLTAQINYERANSAGASFAVQSSPGKYHVYWKVQPYQGNDFYTLIQKKLAQLYDGDKSITDATRVMRVPGFIHLKSEPQLVTGWPLPAIDQIRTAQEMQDDLAHVNIIDHTTTRSPLGELSMAAPSLDWLKFAVGLVDPNDMDRGEWLSFSAAIKQSGWSLAKPEEIQKIWSDWCDRYNDNNIGENLKLWNSINNTEVGWKSIERKSPVKAYTMFGFKDAPDASKNKEVSSNKYGEILSEYDCKEYFKNCYFVERTGQIFGDKGRFMNANQFNGRYGGKQFIITSTGKLTDEPWKAALRSTCWTIPKVDHIRFLPDKPTFEVVDDTLGRRGLNIYIPARIDAREGDISIWFDWFDKILPDKNDQKILFDYIAHCVKFPGYKIPWAPLIQSTQGIGKTIFKELMSHALGDMYVYSPKAQELIKSGSTFNAWMRGKLLIMVDEIKIDERRELIEILKPMITDNRIEIQSKGVDQEMEDNPANWIFFSNYKDAVPINKNDRRYAIFYSKLQNASDLINDGMNDSYFNRLWSWLRNDSGLQAITHWLLNYPIERGAIPLRAPKTSSHNQALMISRSPMEVVINNCIADRIAGFCGGYISTIAVINKSKAAGMRTPSSRVVQNCLETMGFVSIGRSLRPYLQEDVSNRTELYGTVTGIGIEGYGRAQGYE